MVKTFVRGAAVALLLTGLALGSTVLRLNNEELTKRADVIVHGKVTKSQARNGPSNMIVTDYELSVTEFLKGGRPEDKTFAFSALGGKLEDRGFAISGAPVYAVDEEVILFLDKVDDKFGCRTAIGLGQGKFLVKTEEGTSKKHLLRELGGLRLVDKDGKIVGIQEKNGVKLYLEIFVKEIKSYLGEKK